MSSGSLIIKCIAMNLKNTFAKQKFKTKLLATRNFSKFLVLRRSTFLFQSDRDKNQRREREWDSIWWLEQRPLLSCNPRVLVDCHTLEIAWACGDQSAVCPSPVPWLCLVPRFCGADKWQFKVFLLCGAILAVDDEGDIKLLSRYYHKNTGDSYHQHHQLNIEILS